MTPTEIVAALRQARADQGLSLRELSARSPRPHLNPGVVSLWERGGVEPTLTNLHRWATALGYDLTIHKGGTQ